MVQTLQSKGISHVVTEMAAQTDVSFAGRITHFLSNWEVITQDNTRFQDRIPTRTQTKPQALPNNLHTEGGGLHVGRNPRHDKQPGYLRNWERPKRLFLPDISGTEKGRQVKTCYQPEEAKLVSED